MVNVRSGEVWQVGPHILGCGDIERRSGEELLAMSPAPFMSFVDPPWKPGTATSWRTKAGQPARVDYAALRKSILALLAPIAGPCWLIMGDTMQPFWVSEANLWGGRLVRTWRINDRGLVGTLNLLDFHNSRHPLPTVDLQDLNDVEAPIVVCRHHLPPGRGVWDPCVGLGNTAIAADIAGGFCVGLEINATRLTTAANRLIRKGGYSAELLGRLDTMEGANG